jgi:glycylpeptide N-tetradecanoyltransferase
MLSLKKITSHIEHTFWNRQPVNIQHGAHKEGVIKTGDELLKMIGTVMFPYGLKVLNVDFTDEEINHRIMALLATSYLFDAKNKYHMTYTIDFLKAIYSHPTSIFLAFQHEESGNIVGTIGSTLSTVMMNRTPVRMVYINFLCLFKEFRNKNLSPLMISEITKRNVELGGQAAIYTTQLTLPSSLTKATYYCRFLDPQYLMEAQFIDKPKVSMTAFKKLYDVHTSLFASRYNVERYNDDVHNEAVCKLSVEYGQKLNIPVYEVITNEKAKHYFQDCHPHVQCFVLVDKETGKVVDYFSFYTIDSTIKFECKHKYIRFSYGFYHSACTVPREAVLNFILQKVKETGSHAFMTFDVLGQKPEFLQAHKFKETRSLTNYNLYNYEWAAMAPSDCGVILF